MDYQEKLRLAKEALNSSSYDKRTIEYIFPELKENKDEMIRNFLISKMKEVGNVWKEYSSKDIIAWLEKQGEQKANEIHPIFKVGDYIRNKKTRDKVVIEQLDVESEVYCYTSYDGAAVIHSDFPFSKQDEWELIGQKSVEQKSAWSEEDEKMVNRCIFDFEYLVKHTTSYMERYKEQVDWLKSLKERMKGE